MVVKYKTMFFSNVLKYGVLDVLFFEYKDSQKIIKVSSLFYNIPSRDQNINKSPIQG